MCGPAGPLTWHSNSSFFTFPAVGTVAPCLKFRKSVSRRSENTFSLLQWMSMWKQIWKLKKIKKTFVPKIILHNYVSYQGEVAIFPVYLRTDLIFTDFPTGSGSPPCAVLEICKYLMSSLFFYTSKSVFGMSVEYWPLSFSMSFWSLWCMVRRHVGTCFNWFFSVWRLSARQHVSTSARQHIGTLAHWHIGFWIL